MRWEACILQRDRGQVLILPRSEACCSSALSKHLLWVASGLESKECLQDAAKNATHLCEKDFDSDTIDI
jgi:hypothetical protein